MKPIFVQISGGRTSAYMAYLFKDDKDVTFIFQNTGREHLETYKFLNRIDKAWDLNIIYLEYSAPEKSKATFKIVNYETANREGVPFSELNDKRQAVPNKAWRFCTQELKIKTFRRYIRSLGIKKWVSFVGFRADEVKRVESLKKRPKGKTIQEKVSAPLFDRGITATDIGEFWKQRPELDLKLPMLPNGKTVGGNCMGCFWHSEYQNAMLCKSNPEAVQWLIQEEEKHGHTFANKYHWKDLKELSLKVINSKKIDQQEFFCQSEIGGCGI